MSKCLHGESRLGPGQRQGFGWLVIISHSGCGDGIKGFEKESIPREDDCLRVEAEQVMQDTHTKKKVLSVIVTDQPAAVNKYNVDIFSKGY